MNVPVLLQSVALLILLTRPRDAPDCLPAHALDVCSTRNDSGSRGVMALQ